MDNRYTDVECGSFPVELDRASAAEQTSWNWNVSNNTNTAVCPLKNDDDEAALSAAVEVTHIVTMRHRKQTMAVRTCTADLN